MHGAWHDPTCWDDVVADLRSRGHRVLAPDLPLGDPATTYAERVRPALAALPVARTDDGDPIVVVGHSMGAAYAPLVSATLPAALTVLLCPGLGPLRAGFPWPPAGPDGVSVWDPSMAVAALYPRLEPERAWHFAARLRPMAPAADRYPLGRAERAALPTVVVCAADDEMFALETERDRARISLGVDPVEIPGGHLPMLTDPVGLAALLDGFLRRSAS
ncbi:alpha/beta hydrolase [Frankia torreyi]|uniref:alpha/beta fold hydrolase n=1 Tax=Frankia torreyi TaxID=1856 RepID=UPI0005D10C82